MTPHSRLAFFLLALSFAVGCKTTRPDPAAGVLVRDAETGKPLPGAAVRVTNFEAAADYRHPDAAANAGPDGVAWMRIPAANDMGAIVEVKAVGYLSTATPLLTGGSAHTPGVRAVAEVFAGPRPSVVLVLPKKYRGPVRVGIVPRDDLPAEPGRREIRVEVPPSGNVEVEGPPVLRLVLNPDIKAVYADGTELSRDGHDLDVAFRWVRSYGGVEDFVVGTKTEVAEFRRQWEREERPPPGDGGTAPGGRSHGGRHRGH